MKPKRVAAAHLQENSVMIGQKAVDAAIRADGFRDSSAGLHDKSSSEDPWRLDSGVRDSRPIVCDRRVHLARRRYTDDQLLLSCTKLLRPDFPSSEHRTLEHNDRTVPSGARASRALLAV